MSTERVRPPWEESLSGCYVYAFVVWPSESFDFDPAVFDYFRTFRRRVEMHFTAEGFDRFRAGMTRHGLTLHEVTRRPDHEPEGVD